MILVYTRRHRQNLAIAPSMYMGGVPKFGGNSPMYMVGAPKFGDNSPMYMGGAPKFGGNSQCIWGERQNLAMTLKQEISEMDPRWNQDGSKIMGPRWTHR